MSEIKLKNCFCAGRARVHSFHPSDGRMFYRIICNKCETGTTTKYDLNAVIEIWNARANDWRRVEDVKDLPNDGRVYWVTYKDFYKQICLGKGERNGQTWFVGTGHQIPISSIVAVMPEFIPEPFEV